jgi:hypothetical protein
MAAAAKLAGLSKALKHGGTAFLQGSQFNAAHAQTPPVQVLFAKLKNSVNSSTKQGHLSSPLVMANFR